MQSIVTRLYRIRRQIEQARAALRQCDLDDRVIRLKGRQFDAARAAGFPIDPEMPEQAERRVLVRRWRAIDALIRAGSDAFVAGVEADHDMTLAQRLDLLGAGHRYDGEDAQFAVLVGAGFEVPTGYCAGPLYAAMAVAVNPDILEQHRQARSVVEQWEAQIDEQSARTAQLNGRGSGGMHAAASISAAVYVHAAPNALQ